MLGCITKKSYHVANSTRKLFHLGRGWPWDLIFRAIEGFLKIDFCIKMTPPQKRPDRGVVTFMQEVDL